jgi:hypothetical protein
MPKARPGQADRVLHVVQLNAGYAGRGSVLGVIAINTRCAARDRLPVWSAYAGANPSDGDQSAEHAVAADRFAREIVGFLTRSLRRACGS